MKTAKLTSRGKVILNIPIIGAIISVVYITQLGESTMSPMETIFYSVLAGLILAVLLVLFKIPNRILGFISKRFKEKWDKKHAFMFIPNGKHNPIKKLKMLIGESSHLFWVKAYKELELNGFTIRFIPTKGIKSKCKQVPSSVIEIKKAKLKWDTGEEKLYGKEQLLKKEKPIGLNEPSKWRHYFDKPIRRSQEYSIGIEITVVTKKQWKGYFSFEGLSRKRQYGRLKIKVINEHIQTQQKNTYLC